MAACELVVTERSTATADRCVGARDPDAINLDTALNGANAEGHVFLGLLADDLRLEHLGRLCLLPLVDLGVLLDAVLVILQLDQSNEEGYNLRKLARMATSGVSGSVRCSRQAPIAVLAASRDTMTEYTYKDHLLPELPASEESLPHGRDVEVRSKVECGGEEDGSAESGMGPMVGDAGRCRLGASNEAGGRTEQSSTGQGGRAEEELKYRVGVEE